MQPRDRQQVCHVGIPQRFDRLARHCGAIAGQDGGGKGARGARYPVLHPFAERDPNPEDGEPGLPLVCRRKRQDGRACIPDSTEPIEPGHAPEVEAAGFHRSVGRGQVAGQDHGQAGLGRHKSLCAVKRDPNPGGDTLGTHVLPSPPGRASGEPCRNSTDRYSRCGPRSGHNSEIPAQARPPNAPGAPASSMPTSTSASAPEERRGNFTGPQPQSSQPNGPGATGPVERGSWLHRQRKTTCQCQATGRSAPTTEDAPAAAIARRTGSAAGLSGGGVWPRPPGSAIITVTL